MTEQALVPPCPDCGTTMEFPATTTSSFIAWGMWLPWCRHCWDWKMATHCELCGTWSLKNSWYAFGAGWLILCAVCDAGTGPPFWHPANLTPQPMWSHASLQEVL